MKQTILSVFVAVAATLLTLAVIPSRHDQGQVLAPQKESAYDRVMRTGTLRCGYYQWPGIAEMDPNTGKIKGMVPELVGTIGNMLDLKVEYVPVSALGMQVEELKRGVYDTFCVDSYYVFSMSKFVDFGTPYAYFPMFAYGRADDERFTKLADLNKSDVTFVGIDGDLSVTLVGYLFPKAKVINLSATSDASALTVNVATRKADVAIMDPGLIKNYNDNNPQKLKAVDPEHPLAVYPVGFSVAKGEDKLLRMLDSTVSAMVNTGMLTPILEKYATQGGVAWPVANGYAQPLSK